MPKWFGYVLMALFWGGVGAGDLSAATLGAPRAGNPYVVDSWGTDEGLPQNTVTSIVRTRDGYLWFGTLNGLVRFDGTHFSVFDENNTPELGSSRIVKLFEDQQGNLWVGTETSGILMIKEGKVTHLGFGQGPFEKRLVSICEDPRGPVWLYSANGEVWRYWTNRLSPFLFAYKPSVCRCIIAESNGPIWIGADWRMAAVNPDPPVGSLELPVTLDLPVGRLDFLLASRQGGYWRLADNRVQKWKGQQQIRDYGAYPWDRERVTSACEDREGNLIVGTLGRGVFWYGTNGQASTISTTNGLSFDNVLCLCLDQAGALWVGTDGGGLNRVKRQVFEVLDIAQGTVGRAVQSVSEDPSDGLWIGSNGGGAIHGEDGAWQRFGPNQGLPSAYVWSLLVDRQKNVWAGTWDRGLFRLQEGLFQRVPGPDSIQRGIHALFQDRQGRLWVGAQGGLSCWDGQAWQVHMTTNEVQALAEDLTGDLWIGTVGGGLVRWHNGELTAFHRQPGGLPSEDIASLYADAEGVLWIGTPGGGLVRYHQGAWRRYTTREGLESNGIGYIIEDGEGFLWVGSNKGLMRVNKRDLNELAAGRIHYVSCRTYGKPDGLPTRECTQGSQPGACRARDGRLVFSTAKGLVSIHPARLNPNLHPPPVMIESVLVDGQPQMTNALRPQPPSSIVIPAGRERLEIGFASLNLSAPDRGRFQYRLENHETGWTEAGRDRVATYSKLRPGSYRFVVKACNEDGVWNETGCSIAILVETPFWLKWWFLGSLTAGLLGAIIAIVHFVSTQKLQRQLVQMKQQETLDKERSRIAQDIHDQLGASLTQVALLGELVESDKDLPREVESHARQISQTARETTRCLDEIVWAVNPSNDTLDSLVSYLCKYAQDYLTVAGLRYRIEAPEQLPALPVPPDFRHNLYLTFKEAITNIVRHAKATSACVRLRLDPQQLVIEIEDNGCGLGQLDEKVWRTRNGLRGMRKRMESVGGSFDLLPVPSGGALVRLTAPLHNA